MSTSSKPKSRPPAHQNSFAFKHNKKSTLTKKIASTVTTSGLCSRCADKIEWRKKYRKYKPLTAPRKCNACQKKAVKAAYHTLCNPCARERRVCAGCGKAAQVSEEATEQEIAAEEDAVYAVVKALPERQRRTVERRIARGENSLDVVEDYLDVDDFQEAQNDATFTEKDRGNEFCAESFS